MFLNCFALKIKALWSFKYQPTIFQLKWCNIPKDFCVFSSTNVRTSKLANMTKQIGVFFNLCCESITKTGQGNCKECDMLNVQPSIQTLFILKKTDQYWLLYHYKNLFCLPYYVIHTFNTRKHLTKQIHNRKIFILPCFPSKAKTTNVWTTSRTSTTI